MNAPLDAAHAPTPPALGSRRRRTLKLRALLLAAQISLVVVLIVWWLVFDPIWNSRSLWALFFYCFPSEFLLAVVPHEPAILHFAKLYEPHTVALISSAGTVLTEAANYHALHLVANGSVLRERIRGRTVTRVVALFSRAPFTALVVAGVSPLPFYPFRALATLARYPLGRYLLAVTVSRTVRFYLLALLGRALALPGWTLVALFAALTLAGVIPALRHARRR
ncbi:MAG: VTT domain-containing protein [Vicinamibacteria bacterium]|nr:VTT domain-containing protein [Vicinamibacteria bacterium]